MLSKSALFLLTFCLLELSVRERSVEAWTIIVALFLLEVPLVFSLMISDTFLCDAYTVYVVSFLESCLFSLCNVTFHFWKSSYLKWIDLFLSVVWLVLAWLSSLSPRGRACEDSKKVATYKLGRDLGRISTLLISWS